MFYDNFKAACSNRGTTLTTVLKALHRSTSATGNWKSGSYPSLDVVMELAEYLNISIDELVYGEDNSSTKNISEWSYIISNIPDDKQQMCKDFLKTHMATKEVEKKKA